MNILIRLMVIILVHLLVSFSSFQNTFDVTVNIDGLENNEGAVFIAIYNSQEDFLEKTYKGSKGVIKNNSCTVVLQDIPAGEYAVSIFHDENENGKLDTNFMGIPKEDYGCSNNVKGFMGPPKWKDAKFQLNASKVININL